jgi:outer membrane receptor protein involved in Fe transport
MRNTSPLLSVTLFACLFFILSQFSVYGQSTESFEEINLDDISLEQLMNIEVTTASKKSESIDKAPGIVSVVTAKEIEEFGAVNLMDVLERVAGVYPMSSIMYRENVASIRGVLTGHHNKHTLLLINGRPIRESQEGGADFPFFQAFPLATIKRIEVIRGPGSVLYGSNAYSGVINVITKTPEDHTLTLSSHYGTYDTFYSEITGGFTKGDLEMFGGVKLLESDGWKYRAWGEPYPWMPGSPPTRLEGDAEESQLGGMLHLGFRGFTLDAFLARSDQAVVGPIAIPPFGDYDYEKVFLDMGYTHQIQDNWDVSVNATYNGRRSTFPYPASNAPGKEVLERSYLFEVTTRYQLTEQADIMWGAMANNSNGWNRIGEPVPGQDPYSIPRYDDICISTYFQADYRPIEKLKLTVGAQANKVESKDWEIVPRVGLTAHFTDRLGCKLLYGEAYRSPYPVETSIDAPGALIGDSALTAEMIETFDAQLFYHTEDLRVALTGFRSKMKEIITLVPSADPIYPVIFANAGEITLYGGELEVTYKPAEWLDLVGSLSYQESENDNGVDDVTHVPNWMVKTGAVLRPCPSVTLGLFNSCYSEPSDISHSNPSRLKVNPDADNYSWMTANLTVDLSQLMKWERHNVELNVFAKNLLDEDVYLPDVYRKKINSIPERGGLFISAGLKIRF